ncbi:MAG: amino acid ABC transporter ATP-binding protein, partial [Planktothrix sp.]
MTQIQPNTNSVQPTTEDYAILATDVHKWYSNHFHVLRGVSLSVRRGEVVV